MQNPNRSQKGGGMFFTPFQIALLGKLAIERNNIAREQARTLEKIEEQNRETLKSIEEQNNNIARQQEARGEAAARQGAIAHQEAIAIAQEAKAWRLQTRGISKEDAWHIVKAVDEWNSAFQLTAEEVIARTTKEFQVR